MKLIFNIDIIAKTNRAVEKDEIVSSFSYEEDNYSKDSIAKMEGEILETLKEMETIEYYKQKTGKEVEINIILAKITAD